MQRAVFINQAAAYDEADVFERGAITRGLKDARVSVRPVYGKGCQLLGWGVKHRLNRWADWEWIQEE